MGCSSSRGTIPMVKELYAILKGIRLPTASCSRIVDSFKVKILRGFENVGLGATPIGTLVASVVGVVERTFNGAVVVKVQVLSLARALPATSFTRGSVLPPLTRAAYVTPADRSEVGSRVAVNEPAS